MTTTDTDITSTETTPTKETPELTIRPTMDELVKLADGFLSPKDKEAGLTAGDLVYDEDFCEKYILPKWECAQKTEAEKKAELKKKLIASVANRLNAAKNMARRPPPSPTVKKAEPTPFSPMDPIDLAVKIGKDRGEHFVPPKIAFLDKTTCYTLFMLLVSKTKIGFLYDEDSEEDKVYKEWRGGLKKQVSAVADVLAAVHGQTRESKRLQIPDFIGEQKKLEDEINGLVSGEGELICYEFAKYTRFMVPWAPKPYEGLDEIQKADDRHTVVMSAKKAFEAKEAEKTETEKQADEARAVKKTTLVDEVIKLLGNGSEKLAVNVVSKMASKVDHLDFTAIEALTEYALRKMRAGAKPDDEVVTRFASIVGKTMDEFNALLQKEREELAVQAEIQKSEAEKSKDQIPWNGRGNGRKGKPSGKKAKKNNKKGGNNN